MSEGSIQNGTTIIQVRNLDLAVALLSVGVPLREDPPYTHVKFKDGTVRWTFHFEPTDVDGVYKTSDLINAFNEDMKWIEANPRHPFTFCMVAVKNLEAFKSHMLHDVPYLAFKAQGGRAVMYVKEGSKKHKNCVVKRMQQL